jgi:hypothetical protein
VSPAEKRGVLPQWNRHPSTKLSEIIQYAKDYPDYNVGVVGRRGIGNDMFLDIDAEGVLEQIERETGQKMPPTFTVASRPQSAPWKRHYYFKQTAYSVKTFRTETNVKDLSVLKDEKHPTRYDLKGVGGGGLVVGAGSVRADGEVYAGSLASLGTRRSSIERMLAEQSEDFCDSGKTFADSASGKAKFHRWRSTPG